jgi:HPt (histidine-containing phosphotransfer) domain-containing protein
MSALLIHPAFTKQPFLISISEMQALYEKVLELGGGDEAFVAPFVRLLLDTDTATLEALLGAVEASKWDVAASAAHRMTGSLRILGNVQAIKLMSTFEASLCSGEFEQARAVLPELTESIERMEVALKGVLASSACP